MTAIIKKYRPKLQIKKTLNRARFYKHISKIRASYNNPDRLEKFCLKWYKLNEASLVKGLGEEIALKVKRDIESHIAKRRKELCCLQEERK